MLYLYLLAGLASVNAENQDVYIQESWHNGFHGYIRLAPEEDLHGWKIRVNFNAAVGTLQVWNAKIIHESSDRKEFVLTNVDVSEHVMAGSTLKLDFIVRGTVGPIHTATVTLETGYAGPATTSTPCNDDPFVSCSPSICSHQVLKDFCRTTCGQCPADEINDILLSGRIRIVIAELLCENDVEVIFLSSINMDVKHARHKSCRILCKTIRKYCESSRTFYEQLVINEAQLLSSLTTMMPIWNRTQCKALEDILAILSNIVSLEFSCAFRTVITRLIADFYHSLCTRQSMKKAETFYRESFTLIYPCKFNDGHISGRVQFALFYYLNGDYTVALSEINKIHPAIVDVIKNNKVDCYLNLSFPVWLKDRFFHDEFLARLASALLTNFPFIVNVVIIGIYIMIKCIVKICPKERQDDVFALYSLLRECEDQQCTPTACDSYQMIADNLSDTVKEIYHIIQLPPTVKNGMPFTRNQAVKQYWDDW
ncbi:unnamed protein product [Mytilus edulis]|uniref:ShKT domain-containing protein n=1 Tax=Mytilus edulis TaxID=6550 RepID=A0A8S3RG51_MYTED|nr:unnamed protein product [Mytilus edulis]